MAWRNALIFFPLFLSGGGVGAQDNPWLVDLNRIEYRIKHANSATVKKQLIQRAVLHGMFAVPLLVKTAHDSDEQVQRLAISAISKLGPVAAQAESTLVSMLSHHDRRIRQACMLGLVRINSESVDHIITALQKSTGDARLDAIEALHEKFGYRLRPAGFSALISALEDSHGPSLIEKLKSMLSERDPRVLSETAIWLSAFGSRSKPALLNLIRLLGSNHPAVVESAARAIGNMGQFGHVAKADLKRLLTDASIQKRMAAAKALASIGYGELAQNAMRNTIEQSNPNVHRLGLQALPTLPSLREDTLAAVVGVLKTHADEATLRAAMSALEHFAVQDGRVVKVLFHIAESPTMPASSRFSAVSALSACGQNNDRLIRVIKSIQREGSVANAVSEVQVFWRLSGAREVKPFVSTVLPFLRYPSAAVRDQALDTLSYFADKADYAMPYLIKQMVEQPITSEQQRLHYLRLARLITRVQRLHFQKEGT